MQHYVAAASEPKKVLYYDTGHDLNDPQALEDRYDWLVKHINLRREPLFKSSGATLAETRIAVPCGCDVRSADASSSAEGMSRGRLYRVAQIPLGKGVLCNRVCSHCAVIMVPGAVTGL
jgi:predicted transcriptional regulator